MNINFRAVQNSLGSDHLRKKVCRSQNLEENDEEEKECKEDEDDEVDEEDKKVLNDILECI